MRVLLDVKGTDRPSCEKHVLVTPAECAETVTRSLAAGMCGAMTECVERGSR